MHVHVFQLTHALVRTHTNTQQRDEDVGGEPSKPLFPSVAESEPQEAIKKVAETEVPSQGTPEASGSSKQPEE